MEKKLRRTNEDRRIFGVCGGIAKYYDLDPTWVRLGSAALVLFYGTGLLLYLSAALIIPLEDKE